jgi:four helix bundle protein
MDKAKVISFRDLEVYQRSYKASIMFMTKIIPISRSCKAVLSLIAEGYGRRTQQKSFQKYLEDSWTMCNETIVSLSRCVDIYPMAIDKRLRTDLINEYEITGKQIYRLGQSWNQLKGKKI